MARLYYCKKEENDPFEGLVGGADSIGFSDWMYDGANAVGDNQEGRCIGRMSRASLAHAMLLLFYCCFFMGDWDEAIV
jgi:hypothetical protein